MESVAKRQKLSEEAITANLNENLNDSIQTYIRQIKQWQQNQIVKPRDILQNLLTTWLSKYFVSSSSNNSNLTEIQFFQIEKKSVHQDLVLKTYLQDFIPKLQVNAVDEISHLFANLIELDKFFIESNLEPLAQIKDIHTQEQGLDENKKHFFCLLAGFFIVYPVYLVNSKGAETNVLEEQLNTSFQSKFFTEVIRCVTLFSQQQKTDTLEEYLESIEEEAEYIIPISKELSHLNLKEKILQKFIDILFNLLADDYDYVRDSARQVLSQINLGSDRQFELFKQKLAYFEESTEISMRHSVLLFLNSFSMEFLTNQQKNEILQKVYSIFQALIELKNDSKLLLEDECQSGLELEDLQRAACDVFLQHGFPVNNLDETFAYFLGIFSSSTYSDALRIEVLDLLLKLNLGNRWAKLFTVILNILNLSEKNNKDFKIDIYFTLSKESIPEQYRKTIFAYMLDYIKDNFYKVEILAAALFNSNNIFTKDLELLIEIVSKQRNFLHSRAGKKYFSFLLKLAENPDVAEILIRKLFGIVDKNSNQSVRSDNVMVLYAINKNKPFALIVDFFQKNINDNNPQVVFFACLNQIEQSNVNQFVQDRLLFAIEKLGSSFSAENVGFIFSLKVDKNLMNHFSKKFSAYILINKNKIDDILLFKYLLVLVHYGLLEKLDELIDVFCKILIQKLESKELDALMVLFFDLLDLIELKDEYVQKLFETLVAVAKEKMHPLGNTVLNYIIKLCSDYEKIESLGKLFNELDEITIITNDICLKIKNLPLMQKIILRTCLNEEAIIDDFMMMVLNDAICSNFSGYQFKLNENYVLLSSPDKASHSHVP